MKRRLATLALATSVVAVLLACTPTTGPIGSAAPSVASPMSSEPAPTAGLPSASTSGPTPRPTATEPPLAAEVGQKLVVAMSGLEPDAALLARVRAGQIGGIILFKGNVRDAAQVRALTARLQSAAQAAGQPPLIVAIDQEGGTVKRLPWLPPTLSPPEIGATADAGVAREQGRLTGAALRELGINVDLAPVADLPFSTASLLYRQGRTFTFDADLNAMLVDAFAAGLGASGTLPVLKHFPGLGYAQHDTDTTVVTMNLTPSGMTPGLLPYQRATVLPLVMLSNAVYTVVDPANGAGWSPAIVGELLRQEVGFGGVSITDSLTGAAAARGVSESSLAIQAAAAGTDLILVTDGEAATATVYADLLAAARDGRVGSIALQASFDRIIALKARLASGSAGR